ncbi:MAG: ASCH domain-containing protein [Rhodobacteraceae bacterium]|nr:ASCH domain-containing protein [Paracoccaceae bacterium]
MKALSVKQPWANLIASGRKTIETRTWATRHRGPLLIVSSKKPNIAPAGSAVAVAKLVDCRRMTKADEADACCSVYADAVSWILEDVRPIRPFPVKGSLGVYNVPYDPAELEEL